MTTLLLHLSDVDEARWAATYKAALPDVTVLMLSVGDKEQEIAAGLAGGASEYLVKGGPAREIVDAIKRYGPVPGTA